MLSILRVLPMARIAQFVLLLLFVAAGVVDLPQAQAAKVRHRAAASSATHAKAKSSKAGAKSARAKAPARRAKAKPSTRSSSTRASSSRARHSAKAKTASKRVQSKSSRRRGVRRASLSITRHGLAAAHLEAADIPVSRPRPSNSAAQSSSNDDALPARVDPSVAAAELAGSTTADPVATSSHQNPIPAFAGGIAAVAPLRGSFESLARQNEKTDADGLERILDDDDLKDRISQGFLVQVPVSGSLSINQSLPEERRYCRPWTATFLADLSKSHDKRFHTPLYVSSAVRTVEYQKHLIRHNGNAAAATGDIVSPHVTGATIDIAKSRMSKSEIYWMRQRLGDLQDDGKIDVEEEFRQACFHITVYKSYIGQGPLHKKHRPIEPEIGPDDDEPADAANTADAGS